MPRRRLRDAAALARREWRLLVEAALLTVVVRLAVAFIPLTRCAGFLRGCCRWLPHGRPVELERAASIVGLISGRLARQRCLTQTLVLFTLLARRSVDAEVVIGTATHDGRFAAHAWLRAGNRQWLARGSHAYTPLYTIGAGERR